MIWIEKNLFSLIIAVVSLFMFISAFNFNEKARLAPLLVSGAILIMIILQLIIDSYPPSRKWIPFISQNGIFNSSPNKQVNEDEPKVEDQNNWLFVLLMFSILIVFAILLNFTSYLIAIFVFLCMVICLIGKETLISSLCVAIGMSGFMYILFELILKSSL